VPAVIQHTSEANAASMIVTQNPLPGQKIVAGSSVNFEVR
jgi:beta-lactam-binding protein with PASTA domain